MDEDTTLEDAMPTEDDLLGKNGAYSQSIAILSHGFTMMDRKLSSIQINAGGALESVGEFPSYVLDLTSPQTTRDEPVDDDDWGLKLHFKPDVTIRFTPWQVWTYASTGSVFANQLLYPNIGGTSINDDPAPTLPLLASGGTLLFKHTYTQIYDVMAYPTLQWATTDLEIIQVPLGGPMPTDRQVSTNYGLSTVTGNIVHIMFAAYNANRSVIIDTNRDSFYDVAYQLAIPTVDQKRISVIMFGPTIP